MNQLKCPHCNQVLTIDDASYASLLSQVRTAEFQKDVQHEIDLVKGTLATKYEAQLHDCALAGDQKVMAKEREMLLKAQERERQLQASINSLQSNNVQLQNDLANASQRQQLAVLQAVKEVEDKLNKDLADVRVELEYYKNFKTRMSTKAIGESLEQYCNLQFERMRQNGAFRNAYFGKDNSVSQQSGSKGDFIYREMVEGTNIPLISIMFEMKNEMDTTSTKHKNEDFLKELDKDRREKNCEYAVLVSLLEADNDFYNDGIVDMSHKFEKMYVVRPQYFIPIISILRNAALNSVQAKLDLMHVQQANADLVTFEHNIEEFKADIFRNQELAQRKHADAIGRIDNIIAALQKMKEDLQSSDRNLDILSNKVNEKLTVRKMAKGAPSIAAAIESYRR